MEVGEVEVGREAAELGREIAESEVVLEVAETRRRSVCVRSG